MISAEKITWRDDIVSNSNPEPPVLVLMKNGKIIYLNEKVKNILDLDPRLKIGDKLYKSGIEDKEKRELFNLLEKEAELGEPRVVSRNINGRFFSISLTPLLEDNSLTGMSLVFNDTTELTNREKENTLLYQVATILNHSIPARDALAKTLDQIISIMELEDGSILLADRRQQALVNINDMVNLSSKYSFKFGEGIAGWVAKTGQPLAILHTQKEKRFLKKGDFDENYSILSLPMVTKNKLFGVLNLHKRAGEFFKESEMKTFSTIASRLAELLENERLRKWSEHRLELSRILNSTIDLPILIEKSIDEIKKIMDGDDCVVMLWREHRKLFKAYSLDKKFNGRLTKKVIKLELDQLGQFIKDKNFPVLLNEQKKIGWIRDLVNRLELKNARAFPIIIKGQPQGLLIINNENPNRKFDFDEVHLANELSNQLAISVENADLYGRAQREKRILNDIQKTTDQGLISLDINKNIIYANEAVKEIFGIKKPIIGKNLNDILRSFSEFIKKDFEIDKKLIISGRKSMSKHQSFKFNLESNSEPKKYLTVEIKEMHDSENRETGYLIIIDDITDLFGLQEKISERLQQITQLFKISSITAKESSNTVKKIIDYLPELLQAENSIFLLHDKDRNKISEISGSMWKSKQWQKFLTQLFEKTLAKELIMDNNVLLYPQNAQEAKIDPKILPKNMTSLLIYPVVANDIFVGVIITANKLRGKKFTNEDARMMSVVGKQIGSQMENSRLLDEITSEKERISTIINHSGDGMMLIQDDGKIISWNKAMEKLTGYSTAEAVGQNVGDLIKIAHDGTYLDLLNKNIGKVNQGTISEIEIMTKSGEIKWVDSHYSKPANTKDMEFNDLVVIFNDVSRYKELEQEKNEFISMTAHELRTPLTAIKGYLSMILQGDAGELNEKQERYFSRTFKSTERLVCLTEEILNVMRLEEKRMVFQIEPISMKKAAKDVLLDFYQKANQKNIKLNLVNNIKDENTTVNADFNRTKQILANLVDNGLKYTAKNGQVTLKLYNMNDNKKRYIVAEVSDTGVGIDSEQLGLIFSKFHRIANPLSKQAGGYGLGLFITKSLVEQQGGKIWVESEMGHGSKFSIALPMTNIK